MQTALNPQFLQSRMMNRACLGRLRTLPLPVNGIDFCSNDYFGFARLEFVTSPSRRLQFGASGSRLVSGQSEQLAQLELKIAAYHNAEAALLFNSGYAANLGLFSSFFPDDVELYYDEHVHASIRDGARIAGLTSRPFRHNDVEHLKSRLKSAKKCPVVAVEAIYSMSGDKAPLQELVALCTEHAALLIVDEAHSGGVCGPKGSGLVCELGLTEMVFARIFTYGKAFGCFGASVAGSRQLKEYLVNFARSIIYSTALPPVVIDSIDSAYDVMTRNGDGERNRLNDNLRHFKNGLTQFDLRHLTRSSISPIQGLYLDPLKLIDLAHRLRACGYETKAILSPTVKRGTERLRMVLHSSHSFEEITGLLHAIKGLV